MVELVDSDFSFVVEAVSSFSICSFLELSVTSISSSLSPFLKPRMASPSDFPKPGILLGPKMTRTMAKTIKICQIDGLIDTPYNAPTIAYWGLRSNIFTWIGALGGRRARPLRIVAPWGRGDF